MESLPKEISDKIDSVTNTLMCELNRFRNAVTNFNQTAEKLHLEYSEERSRHSLEKQLKSQEGYYDRVTEVYKRNQDILSCEQRVQELFHEFLGIFLPLMSESKNRHEEIGNTMNILLEQMKDKEIGIKGKEFSVGFEIKNYEKYVVETELKKKEQEEEEEIRKQQAELQRTQELMRRLEEEETRWQQWNIRKTIEFVEKHTSSFFGKILFDSDIHNWSTGKSDFYSKIHDKSNIIILIETTENKLFGCYLESKINAVNQYTEDSKSFIFKHNQGGLTEKYPIKYPKRVMKIFDETEKILFVVGCSWFFRPNSKDIVIKKKEEKNTCYCCQSSFDYHGKENALIGRKGEFAVKRIIVIGTISWEEHMQYTEVFTRNDAKYFNGVIPPNILRLDDYCLSDCIFSTITIPTTIKELPKGCFEGSHQLQEVTIPTSVTKLGDCCFANCSSLPSLNIPTSVVEIGNNCFHNCMSLSHFEIPTSVQNIGNGCFLNCKKMLSIIIPTSLRILPESCFSGCERLQQMVIPTSIRRIRSQCFRKLIYLTSLIIPTSVVQIDNGCFDSMMCLKSIEIPTSVTELGRNLFDHCVLLTSITIPTTNWKLIGNRLFNIKVDTFEWTELPNSIFLLNGTDVEIKEVEKFTIPTNVTELDNKFFQTCKYTKIRIPQTITNLPNYCFQSCEQIKKIVIPVTITKLPNSCFEECTQLQNIIIPTTVTKLGDFCFASCSSLTSLKIPSSVLKIGNACFKEMTSLESLTIPSNVVEFGSSLFYGCSSLTSITLHDNYTEVQESDFEECTSLQSIELSSTLTRFGNWAFRRCISLESIEGPRQIELGIGCFSYSGINQWDHPNIPDYCF